MAKALVEPLADDVEGILYADLDTHMITIAKTATDPVGHYARPDVVSLNLNRTKRRVVTERTADSTTNESKRKTDVSETDPTE